MDATYAEVGTEVVIGFGDWCPDYNRYPSMRALLGTQTVIIEVDLEFSVECPWCRVKADGGKWWWPVCDMILASDIDLLAPEQKSRIR